MTTKIYASYSDFLKRENKSENGVSEEFAKNNPNFLEDNATNEACWNCSSCSYCSYCSGKENLKVDSETEHKAFPEIPKIKINMAITEEAKQLLKQTA